MQLITLNKSSEVESRKKLDLYNMMN